MQATWPYQPNQTNQTKTKISLNMHLQLALHHFRACVWFFWIHIAVRRSESLHNSPSHRIWLSRSARKCKTLLTSSLRFISESVSGDIGRRPGRLRQTCVLNCLGDLAWLNKNNGSGNEPTPRTQIFTTTLPHTCIAL